MVIDKKIKTKNSKNISNKFYNNKKKYKNIIITRKSNRIIQKIQNNKKEEEINRLFNELIYLINLNNETVIETYCDSCNNVLSRVVI